MKTMILAAAAVLSLGVGSAYAQGAPAGFADGTDYQGPGAGLLTAHRRSLTTATRPRCSFSDPTRFSGRC